MRKLIFLLFPLFCLGQNLSDSDAIYFGSTEITKVYFGDVVVWSSGCTLTTGNVFPSGNSASECTNEADSIGGFTGSDSTVSSYGLDSIDGDFSIFIESTSTNGSDRANISFSVANATTYNVSFFYKVLTATSSSNAGIYNWTGVTSSPSMAFNDDGEWHEVSLSVTTNSTTLLLRFYSAINPATAGSQILIDKIVIST
jgi:hypothetical protein